MLISSRQTLIASLLSLSTSINAYWATEYKNDYSDFRSSSYSNVFLNDWLIKEDDHYIPGNFYRLHASHNSSMVIGIKPGIRNAQLAHFGSSSFSNDRWNAFNTSNTGDLANFWSTSANDLHAVGNFDGDSWNTDEVLFANPDGRYQTLTNPTGVTWTSLQSASNGDIDHDDHLLAGDFNGDGKDEVILIKQNGTHHLIEYNPVTSNWDILHSSHNGQIHWWVIGQQDHYLIGDYNGDGRDELLALNPNGWSHLMAWTGSQWQYLTGGNSGLLGNWTIRKADQYVTGDFNQDGKDEILAVNVKNGWSQTLGLSGNQWTTLLSNQGNQQIGQQRINYEDRFYRISRSNQEQVLVLSGTGNWHFVTMQ